MIPEAGIANGHLVNFEPAYTLGERLALPVHLLGFTFCLVIIFSGNAAWIAGIVGALGFGIGILVHTATYPRCMQFSVNGFTIYRFLWPEKRISYSEVVDLGINRLVTSRGVIHLTRFQNREALEKIITSLIESGQLDVNRFVGRALEIDLWRRSGLIGATFGLLAGKVVGISIAVLGWYPVTLHPVGLIVVCMLACAGISYMVCRFFLLIRVRPASEEPKSASSK